MSSRCLEDVFSITVFCLPRRLQDVFKTSWKMKNCYGQDVLRLSSRHVLKRSWKPTNVCWVNTFDSTCCKMAIEQKLSGFPPSPFSHANIMTQDFHTSRNVFAVQAFCRLFVRHECRTGHFLTVITLIWSRRQCDTDNFLFMMTFVSYAEVGGSRSVVGF